MVESKSEERFTAFVGKRCLARGRASEVALALRAAYERGDTHLATFDDATGRPVDFDLRGGPDEIFARYARPPAARRGRPKLGVVSREITLLPRHWEWLAQQPGGASATLRRLVQEASRSAAAAHAARRDTTYRAMSALAGDLPRFEDASRALFAGDEALFLELTAHWPEDVTTYLAELLREPQGAGRQDD